MYRIHKHVWPRTQHRIARSSSSSKQFTILTVRSDLCSSWFVLTKIKSEPYRFKSCRRGDINPKLHLLYHPDQLRAHIFVPELPNRTASMYKSSCVSLNLSYAFWFCFLSQPHGPLLDSFQMHSFYHFYELRNMLTYLSATLDTAMSVTWAFHYEPFNQEVWFIWKRRASD